jgi:hypothetical protein
MYAFTDKQIIGCIKMKNSELTYDSIGSTWSSRLFIVAGVSMLINVILLWVRRLSDYELSILWPAIPSLIALACAVFGLLNLYKQASFNTPFIAKVGAFFSILACTVLGIAAIWLIANLVFFKENGEQLPQWFFGLIAVFMISMILAFLSNAVAFLQHTHSRNIGLLLSIPLAMWLIMLLIGLMKGMQVGLSLDFYTNAVIATAFLFLGLKLRSENTPN